MQLKSQLMSRERFLEVESHPQPKRVGIQGPKFLTAKLSTFIFLRVELTDLALLHDMARQDTLWIDPVFILMSALKPFNIQLVNLAR